MIGHVYKISRPTPTKREIHTNIRWGNCFVGAMQEQQLCRVVTECNFNRSQYSDYGYHNNHNNGWQKFLTHHKEDESEFDFCFDFRFHI